VEGRQHGHGVGVGQLLANGLGQLLAGGAQPPERADRRPPGPGVGMHHRGDQRLDRRGVDRGFLGRDSGPLVVGPDVPDGRGRLGDGDRVFVGKQFHQRRDRGRGFESDQPDRPGGMPADARLLVGQRRHERVEGGQPATQAVRDGVDRDHPRAAVVGGGQRFHQCGDAFGTSCVADGILRRLLRPARRGSLLLIRRFLPPGRLGHRFVGLRAAGRRSNRHGRVGLLGRRSVRLRRLGGRRAGRPCNQANEQRQSRTAKRAIHGGVRLRQRRRENVVGWRKPCRPRLQHRYSAVARFQGPKYTLKSIFGLGMRFSCPESEPVPRTR